MSIDQRKNAQGKTVFRYRFTHQGQQFHGRYLESRRAAEAAERKRRAAVEQGETGEEDPRERITLDQAAWQYWDDVAQHHRSAGQIKRKIETLLRLFGADTPIKDIRTAQVNEAIKTRRAEPVLNVARERGLAKRGETGAGKPRSTATVNRDIIDQLRPILNHAAEIHELALPRIAWKKMRLDDGKEIVREYSPAEISAWASNLAPVEKVFLGIALTYGCRFGELFFPPQALINADGPKPILELGRYKGRSGRMYDSRKDKTLLRLAILPEHAALLASLVGRASAAGLDVIWFDEAIVDERSVLTEITYWGMRGRLLKAAAKAGIEPGRILHGMRHHAGTMILRHSKNLALAQKTLGHKQIKTTGRYAHIDDEDVREGLAAASGHAGGALRLTKTTED